MQMLELRFPFLLHEWFLFEKNKSIPAARHLHTGRISGVCVYMAFLEIDTTEIKLKSYRYF